MHQDVRKILGGLVEVSPDVVSAGDEIATLTCDCCDACVDGCCCCCSSCWLTICKRLVSLSILLVECSQSFLMSPDAVVDGFSVISSTLDVVESDKVDLVEGCVEVGHERKIVELKKSPDF